MTDVTAGTLPWYRALTATQWRTLIATNLGWLFDGYEAYALFLTVAPAMRSLLDPSQYAQIPAYAGTVVAITLLGWGIGGFCGGILADYIGRRRMMIYAILAYSILTGLTAISFNWISFALLRFLVGIAIGSEWATGSSMIAELWPNEARGRGAGLMQCGLGIGFFLASFVWLFVGALGPEAWRYMFVIGILPALLTIWIRTSIDESAAWQRVDAQRREARARKDSGAALSAHEQALTRFTIADLFAEPETRRRIVLAFLMSLTTTLAWWGISSWVPPYIASVAAKANLPGPQWASYAGMAYNLGGILGYASFGSLAGRRGGECVLHPRSIFVDAGLAAGIVPDALARHRHCVFVQCAALHRLSRPVVCRGADRPVRRVQPRRDDHLLHLRARFLRRAVPAGDQGQTAAGIIEPLIPAPAGI